MTSKTLQYFLEKKHVRYMPPPVKEELFALVPNCKGDAAEALFWVLNNISDYPSCEGCGEKLSSFHWEPFLKPQLRKDPNVKQGYRPFCGKSCAYKFGSKTENFKKTCVSRYGVDHPMKIPETVFKIKATNIDRYGEPHPMKWTGEKFLSAMRERYGTTVVRHIPHVHNSIIETIAQKTTEFLPERIEKIEEQFDVECLTDISKLGKIYRVYEIEFLWRHSCGREYESGISERGIRRCPSCSSGTNAGEQEVADFIRGLGWEVVQRTKSVIAPRELDIWVPEANIAIEFDGTYWHSAKFQDKNKCLEKLEACDAKGIQLITLQEHLWVNKPNAVKNRLMSIFFKNPLRIAGRQTKVKRISSDEAKVFLATNHLQGSARSTVQYGLFLGDELVSVATFAKPRWAKKFDWELIRMASKPGVTVQGGASKLISAFRKEHSGSLISYADRCWSTGNVYRQVGFEFSHYTSPSYWWIHHHLGTYARYQTQKKKLPKLLGDLCKKFYPELSEDDNMRMAGFLPLYDRGNSVWVLR